MTAISMTTGGMVLSAGPQCGRRRANAANERDKPQRGRAARSGCRSGSRSPSAEAEIARIGGIIEKIDAALALPDIFTRDPKQAAQLAKARAAAADALQRAEEEWLEASAELDEAAS